MNTEIYRLLAKSDPRLFLEAIKRLGFKPTLNETEDKPLPPELQEIQELADALGFLVRYNLDESAPPGWEKTVEKMKKDKSIDNPFALAWSMYKKGQKPKNTKK